MTRLVKSLSAFLLLLAATMTVHADPISGTAILVSLAISAALSAASIGLQLLFQPKPKPVDKNKLQGDIQLTSVGEDIPITEQYGASLGDGIGGIRTGGIIMYASQIRKTVITTPGQTTGGGKGAPKAPPNREYHYFIDLAILVGRGPLRVRQVKANTDLLYQDFTHTNNVIGTSYEAEAATGISGGVTSLSDADFSGGSGKNVPHTDNVEWNNVLGADDSSSAELYIVYKSTADIDITFTVNGVDQSAVLPDSFGLVASVDLPNVLNVGTNTIRITNNTAATLKLDRLVVGLNILDPGTGDDGTGCYISGVRYEGYTNPESSYDPITLRDPLLDDPRGCQQFNYQANATAQGDITAPIPGGTLRWYPGTTDQLPDPMLQAHFEAIYGAGSTPAFRGRCYAVLENFEITKYGTVPNFTFVTEHQTANTVGEMFAARAARAGLDVSEFDFTDLEAVPLRGFAITQKQAPAKEMELLCRVFDVDVYEDFDGVIKGIVPSETLDAEIPMNELAMQETESNEGDPFAPVITQFQDARELAFFLDVSYFDPTNDWNVRNVHALRESNVSDKKDNIETGIVFLESEAQKFADRDLHKSFVEKDGIQVSLSHKYTYLAPTNLISVQDTDASVNKMRVKSIDGWLPGALGVKGVSRDALHYPPRLFTVPDTAQVPKVIPPAPIIGTFVDIALFDEQARPGFYVCAALTDTHYSFQGASLYRLGEDSEWEALAGIRNQSTMGRTLNAAGGLLADVPGGWVAGDWDDTNTVTVDLYFGELESLTDDQVLIDKRNYLVVGNELIQFGTATKVGGFPNRWTVLHLQRRLNNTDSTSHTTAERAVLYTAAWLYLEQDPRLAGTSRTYKFVGAGGDLDSVSSVDFNWTGATQYIGTIYATVDSNVPTVTTAPTVSQENGYWLITAQRPSANGYSADICEIHVRKSSDDSLVRSWDIGNAVTGSIVAQAFDCKAKYRWRNHYRLNGSDGWSAYSADTSITSGSVSSPGGTIGGGDSGDPGDLEPPCFIDGVEVLLADWTAVDIEKITNAHIVMSWMPNGRLLHGKVRAVRHEMVDSYHELTTDDDMLGVTEFHGFEEDWNRKVIVKDMLPGQQLRAWEKGWGFALVKDNQIITPDAPVRVTNFEVAVWHRYFVRGKGSKKWKAVYNMKIAQ